MCNHSCKSSSSVDVGDVLVQADEGMAKAKEARTCVQIVILFNACSRWPFYVGHKCTEWGGISCTRESCLFHLPRTRCVCTHLMLNKIVGPREERMCKGPTVQGPDSKTSKIVKNAPAN